MNQTWRTRINNPSIQKEDRLFNENLSLSEKQKFGKLQSEKRRIEFIASRKLMRKALSHYYKLPEKHWQITERAKNAPQVLNAPEKELYLSLSHSDDCVLLAFSQAAVGVDLEKTKPLPALKKIAQKVFTPAECTALFMLAPSKIEARFFELWTLKEASIKMAKALGKPQFLYSNKPWQFDGFHFAHTSFDQQTASLVSRLPLDQFSHFELSAQLDVRKTDFISPNQ